ncbi:MAG: hypothetical protein IJL02_11360 [Methanobrevibacter sp.]|uniref:hypothetical protein n=1 Tax=Methanobrevibacter sp. TaxID=66852 RepID=UPI0025D4B871|nr:hypothetical protein [Methanobrevibacter sp.]MBQ6100443.1 hypothetical protein [Methanobrevibacter sp.]
MNITKYPQFQLYLLTLHMLMLKNQLIPKNCDEWCVNASIINRAYYSAFLYCELWLEYVKNFKIKHPWEFDENEERIGEHKQVREALKNFGEKNMKTELYNLFKLRQKADYNPFIDITPQEVADSINHMEKIYKHLKFN